MVKIEGVKTPPKVPNPVGTDSMTLLEDDSEERDVMGGSTVDHLNLAANGANLPPNSYVACSVSNVLINPEKCLKNYDETLKVSSKYHPKRLSGNWVDSQRISK